VLHYIAGYQKSKASWFVSNCWTGTWTGWCNGLGNVTGVFKNYLSHTYLISYRLHTLNVASSLFCDLTERKGTDKKVQ